MPNVSVVMPTYKRRLKMVRRAIESVLAQSYKELELIIIDDSPPDYEYRKEIEEFVTELLDSRIKLIQHPENLGANVARNTGIKYSQGEYIAFLDDDDEWQNEKIEKQMKKFNKSNIALVYCSANEITTKENRIIHSKVKKAKYKGCIFDKLMSGNVIGSTSSVIIKKRCLHEVGIFDNNLKSAQDYELYLRIAFRYLIEYVDGEPMLNYYIHEGERITGNYNVFQISRDYIQEKHIDKLNSKGKLFSDFLFQRAKISLSFHDITNAFEYIGRGTIKYPLNIIKYFFVFSFMFFRRLTKG